jgi:NAD(P)-dependent dehydrogenase (short-subunit alcohol dehydrogenase family)
MGIVCITGTSTGIGQATAITLARSGHTVIAGMRNLERGGELRAVSSKESLPITIVQVDVDSDTSVDDAFKRILREKCQIDVLVNNAGIGARGPIEFAAMDSFKAAMETNFFGTVRCIKAVVPSMRERRSGCIINIGSVAGRFGMAIQGPYAASKWAIEGMTECLAQELSPFNIRVAVVEPGVIATPLTTTPRPAPPPNPYTPAIRRIATYFSASLQKPTSPFVVAQTVQDIIDGKTSMIRNPTGADGAALIEWRTSKTDEEWARLGSGTDAEWAADAKKYTGINVNFQ